MLTVSLVSQHTRQMEARTPRTRGWRPRGSNEEIRDLEKLIEGVLEEGSIDGLAVARVWESVEGSKSRRSLERYGRHECSRIAAIASDQLRELRVIN